MTFPALVLKKYIILGKLQKGIQNLFHVIVWSIRGSDIADILNGI